MPSKKKWSIKMAKENDHDIYIDVYIPLGVGADTDSGAGGTRSVEASDQFDALSTDCSHAGI